MAHSLDLSLLYYFSSPSACVLEAKINGLTAGTPPDKVFHWLYFDRSARQFHKLDFKAMGSEGDRHYRVFAQGELWFDASRADLSLQTGQAAGEFALDVLQVDSIAAEFIDQVQRFLQSLD